MKQNRRIVIHGAINGSNFGDCLFADIFLNEIKLHKNVDVYFAEIPFFGIGKNFREILNYSKRVGIKKTLTADALVFMAGGYFGQPGNSRLDSIIRYYRYFWLGNWYATHHKHIGIIGLGAGPVFSSRIRRAIHRIVENADMVSVRDEESLEFMKKLNLGHKVVQTADVAIAVVDDWSKKNTVEKEDAIFIHAGGISKDEAICICEAIQELRESKGIRKIYAGNDGKIDSKNENIQKIYELYFGNDFEFLRYRTPYKLLSDIKRSKLVITKKLHVGIVASAMGVSVISFPRHLKTKRFYKQINEENRCSKTENISKEAILSQIKAYYDRPIVIPNEVLENSRKNICLLHQFIDMIDS